MCRHVPGGVGWRVLVAVFGFAPPAAGRLRRDGVSIAESGMLSEVLPSSEHQSRDNREREIDPMPVFIDCDAASVTKRPLQRNCAPDDAKVRSVLAAIAPPASDAPRSQLQVGRLSNPSKSRCLPTRFARHAPWRKMLRCAWSKVRGAISRCARFRRRARTVRCLSSSLEKASGPEVDYTFAIGLPPAAQVYTRPGGFVLQEGGVVDDLEIAYETWGRLNRRKDNAILLFCGMSASSHACSNERDPRPGWWEEFIGPGLALDTNIFYIICANNLGSCYGSTGPSSVAPSRQGCASVSDRYGSRFPAFTVQDMVSAQFELLDYLGIDTLHAAVGSSLGGMMSLSAAAQYPERVQKLVSISAAVKTYPGSIALRQMQRECIMADPNWQGGDYYGKGFPSEGLRLARQAGTISYRSGPEWESRFGRERVSERLEIGQNFQIESYIRHQGQRWAADNVFDANSLVWISTAMDAFSVERKISKEKAAADPAWTPLQEGLQSVLQPTLIIGVQTDVLFPHWQQREMANALRSVGNQHVTYYELDALFGHDTFLLDRVNVGGAIKGHLEQEPHGVNRHYQEAACGASLVVRVLQQRDYTRESAEEVFDALDTDNNGLLSVDEVAALLYLVTQTTEGADADPLQATQARVRGADMDDDGSLTRDEFVRLLLDSSNRV